MVLRAEIRRQSFHNHAPRVARQAERQNMTPWDLRIESKWMLETEWLKSETKLMNKSSYICRVCCTCSQLQTPAPCIVAPESNFPFVQVDPS